MKSISASVIRNSLIIFLGARCALCDKSYPDKKSWTVHHRIYRPGEMSSRDFKSKISHRVTRGKNRGKMTKKTVYDVDGYYAYLEPLVYDHPKDFAPLHNSCHQSVTRGARWGKESGNRQRYVDLIMEQD